VILEVPPQIMSLAKTLGGNPELINMGEALPEFDYQIPLLSIPLAYGTTLETIPHEVPYLTADAEKVRQWRQRMAGDTNFKVGVAWAGSPHHKRDRDRSLPLEAWRRWRRCRASRSIGSR